MEKVKIKVTETDVIIESMPEKITAGNIEFIDCAFDLAPVFKKLVIRASFNGKFRTIEKGFCKAPKLNEGICKLGVYGYELDPNGEYRLCVSPMPTTFFVNEGSFNDKDIPAEDPTPDELDAHYALIKNLIDDGLLRGEQGAPGESAYEIAVHNGYQGTEEEWLNSLKGLKGEKGDKGDSYILTDADKQEISEQVNIPVKDIKVDQDSIVLQDGTATIPYASASKAGIMRVPNGCGISVDETGSAKVNFPMREITSHDKSIEVTNGDGTWNIEVDNNKFVENTTFWNALEDKANTSDIPSLEGYATEEWVNNTNYEAVLPLALSADTKTYLTNLEDGLYVVSQRGNLSTSIANNAGATVNKGTYLRVFTTYSKDDVGIKNCILWVGSNVYVFNEKSTNVISEKLSKNNNFKTINGESIIGTGDISLKNQSTLIADITVAEACAAVDITTDLNGAPFSYQKVILEFTFPEPFSSVVHPYIQLGSSENDFGNVCGYTAKGFKYLNGMIERLPNGHFKCDMMMQSGEYYCAAQCSVINNNKYIIRNTDIHAIRFTLRQDEIKIPVGTAIQVWGISNG